MGALRIEPLLRSVLETMSGEGKGETFGDGKGSPNLKFERIGLDSPPSEVEEEGEVEEVSTGAPKVREVDFVENGSGGSCNWMFLFKFTFSET